MVFIPISLFSQNDVCFELEGNPYANHPAFGIFSKSLCELKRSCPIEMLKNKITNKVISL